MKNFPLHFVFSKNLSCILLITIILGCSAHLAMAQEHLELGIMGTPLQDEVSHSVLALVCVNTNCDDVQFFLKELNQTPKAIGPILHVPQATDEKLKEEAIHFKIREYFATHEYIGKKRKKHPLTEQQKSNLVDIGLFAGVPAVVYGATKVGYSAPFYALGAGVLYGVWSLFHYNGERSIHSEQYFSHESIVSKVSSDALNKDGWSWGEKINEIPSGVFSKMTKILTDDQSYHSTEDFKKLNKARKKLLKAGVEF